MPTAGLFLRSDPEMSAPAPDLAPALCSCHLAQGGQTTNNPALACLLLWFCWQVTLRWGVIEHAAIPSARCCDLQLNRSGLLLEKGSAHICQRPPCR